MALTGLEIFKQLPKKNCGECGVPTCLAFAMALASGKVSLDACPYVAEEAKEVLESASKPPIKLVKIGTGKQLAEIGDETELFRHDKRFFHPTALAIAVKDSEDVTTKIKYIDDLRFERAGLQYQVDLVALYNDSGDPAQFEAAVEAAMQATELPPILITEDVVAIKKALEVCAERNPLLYAATTDNYIQMAELAKSKAVPLAVYAENLEELAQLVKKITKLGHNELVLDSGQRETHRVLADLTQIRRLAIKKKYRPFGYPTIAFTNKDNPQEEIVQAGVYLSKYAGIIVLNAYEKQQLLPLLTWRQNLYTDPQKPIQVEAKLYAIGGVGEHSPVYCTTNFSLTYFIVKGEVENSRIPSYILAVDTGGTSVLTAYADGKFTAETITKAMKDAGLDDKVKERKIIIPGQVAILKGKLEEESGWEVIVGPREAAGIPKFVKNLFA
ncbi:MAG: acetyl-CoA decarbonylase/synthase complex subunit gamma [Dethiobacteria bacterium]|jgi:acetyl-CoA decarbonylase/synthase complex subunit gamma